ncbi:MAG: hypothetical protein HYY49_02235 [Ignavibacteriales bacterium]|nr:hypothetical protein [Ignavibacteriales bacterium]
MDEERFGKVVAKVIRGLYYFEYSAPLLSSTEVLSQFLQSESDATEPIKFNDQLLFGSRQWPNVFEYRFNRIEDLPLCSMWLIRFWGKIVFWAITGNDSDFAKNEILPSHSKTPTAA